MLPSIGLAEALLLAAIALVVVGPKDLPLLARRVGQFFAQMRGLASEFRESFDELGRQAELDEIREEAQKLRELDADINAELGNVEIDMKKAAFGDEKDPNAAMAPPQETDNLTHEDSAKS